MPEEELFAAALGLQSLWHVSKSNFSEKEKRLEIDFEPGSQFFCPICGKPGKAYDTK